MFKDYDFNYYESFEEIGNSIESWFEDEEEKKIEYQFIKNFKRNLTYIEKAQSKFGDYFDYRYVDYVGDNSDIFIKCPYHGIFSISPSSHLRGGCPDCNKEVHKIKGEKKFFKKSLELHSDKYNYDKTVYKNTYEKIIINCPKHGDFLQTPHSHMNGTGCPKCKRSKGEEKVARILELLNINYKEQKTYDDCKHKQSLSFDFYLPQYDMLIEYDGEFHYMSIEGLGGEESLQSTQRKMTTTLQDNDPVNS